MPSVKMSASSSGGVSSRVACTVRTMAMAGSMRASIISSEFITVVSGRPLMAWRPFRVKVASFFRG